jgi:hypothetical protein
MSVVARKTVVRKISKEAVAIKAESHDRLASA